MKVKYMTGVALTVGLLVMGVANAGGLWVDINKVEELACGEQKITFNGYVKLHEGYKLVAEFDKSEIGSSVNQGEETWHTGPQTLTVGSHELYVYVIEEEGGWERGVPDDLWEFEIEECSTPTPLPESPTPTPSEEPKDEGSNDPGDEQDCEVSTNPDACGEGYINEGQGGPEPVGQVKGVQKEATPSPVVEQNLEKLPSAGPNALLPLMLVGSWFSVAVVGFSKKW